MVENSLNPFNEDADPDNGETGKSCKKSTEDFLLNVESVGSEAKVYTGMRRKSLSDWRKIKKILIKSTILQQT